MPSAPAGPDISLDELGRLIRLLGMLGSQHDGEALNAARLAVKWVAEKSTSWEALLTPLPEPAVAGVAVAGTDPGLLDALEETHAADRAQAYRNGFQAGLQAMAAQLKAQASGFTPAQPAGGPGWACLTSQNGYATMARSPAGGLGSYAAPGQGLGAQGPQGGHAGGGGAGGMGQGPGGQGWAGQLNNPHPPGSWQAVAWELLKRDAAGIPGVFHGSREATFVADVLGRGFASLTQAQETWLRDIAGRSALSW